MLYPISSGDRPGSSHNAPLVLLWFALILLPVAHLSIGQGIPMYWSEALIGFSLLAFVLSEPGSARNRLRVLLQEETRFLAFGAIFLAGIALAYGVNQHSFSGLGEIKSFYIIPILFCVAILIQGETRSRLESLAMSWLLGLAAAAFAAALIYRAGWLTFDGRLASFYLSPNYLAMLLAPGILLSAYFFATSPGYRYRIGALIVGAIIAFALWMTRSYAAWVAVAIAFAVGVVLWQKWERCMYIVLFFVSLAILGGMLLRESGTEKWQSLVSGDERSSFASRVMIWKAGVKIAEDSFPIGIGTGRFQTVYLENQKYFPTYLEWAVPTPHNLYLHFLLEGGVLAVIGWIGCVVIVLARVIQRLRQGRVNPLCILGLALIVFYLAYGLVDTPYMKNDLALAVWGSLGICLAACRIKA